MIWNILAALGRAILRRRYKIIVTGLDEIISKGKKGILILPNHPALIDPPIMATMLKPLLNPRILADKDQVELPVIKSFLKSMNAILMPDPAAYGESSRKEVEDAIKLCGSALASGDNLLVYPSGHIYRSRFENIGSNSSVETILKAAPDARIVLVKTKGLWGSSLSWAYGKAPTLKESAPRGIRGVLSSFIFFAPKRKVTITFCEPKDFPKHKSRIEINSYLEKFYNKEPEFNTYVPFSIWEKGGIRNLPEPETIHYSGSTDDVPAATRELIYNHLAELTGINTINETHNLSADLGIDSLSKIELITWLESEFGFPVTDPEALQKVSDMLIAACGISAGGSLAKLNPVPVSWFSLQHNKIPVTVPEGATITEVFLKQAKLMKKFPMATDQTRGVIRYTDAVTAIMVLKPLVEKCEGKYIGLMFPALSIVPVIYLAVLFSGKIPVMINWTIGSRSIRHSLQLLNVSTVITSAQFLSKIESQGVNLDDIREHFNFLEDMVKKVSRIKKLRTLIKSRISWRSLEKCKIENNAVVLFTSGSETFPKAVPLTHENILTNVRDAFGSFNLFRNDTLIGFLPPFHSFGLTTTVILPFAGGLCTVYHPNPTEGKFLARIINAYKVSVLIGTPTFLDGITRNAEDHEIDSLRLVVSGAEKCPARLYDLVNKRWPKMTILEGYGITECSPIVSVNREDDPHPSTIGKILPSVEFVIRDVDTGDKSDPGKTGMLLVRGKSIFNGYLNYDGESPFEEFDGKQWYRTGDLVREENGVLVFSGRQKRFIKLGGEMISLPAIEEILLKKFQPMDEDLILAVESTSAETNPEIVLFITKFISREEANVAIREGGLSPIHNIRQIRMIGKIPLLGTGKTDYRALKMMLEKQTENHVINWSNESMK